MSNKQELELLFDVIYLDWVAEHLTLDFEVIKVIDHGEVELWFDPR